jgi:DNA-binding XRE family transcriptional regulator
MYKIYLNVVFKCYINFNRYIEIDHFKPRLMNSKNNEKLRELVGSKLIQLRNERNLSYRKLAQLCNVDHSQISKIEKGKISAQLDTLFDLAGALKIHPKEFFDFEYQFDNS